LFWRISFSYFLNFLCIRTDNIQNHKLQVLHEIPLKYLKDKRNFVLNLRLSVILSPKKIVIFSSINNNGFDHSYILLHYRLISAYFYQELTAKKTQTNMKLTVMMTTIFRSHVSFVANLSNTLSSRNANITFARSAH